MASINIFDPTTKNSKSISIGLGGAVIIQDLDGQHDYYITLATSAKMITGDAIPTHIIRTLSDGAGGGGTTTHEGGAMPYATMSEAVNDHIRRMMEGDLVDPDTAMDFS